MDMKNLFLYGAFAIVSFTLWNDWKASNNPIIEKPAIVHEQTPVTTNEINSNQLIHVKTDVLDVNISLDKGQIVDADLLKYPQSIKSNNKPFKLFNKDSEHSYFTSAAFVTMQDNEPQNLTTNFVVDKYEYTLQPSQAEIKIILRSRNPDGVDINKIFTFKKGSYVIDADYELINNTTKSIKTYLNQQISWKNPESPEASMFQIGSFTGASYGQPGKTRYKKLSFDKIKQQNLDEDASGGWVAMQQHYFLTALIPNQSSQNRIYSQYKNYQYTIGMVSEAYTVEANKQRIIESKLYVGPEDTAVLKTLAPGLDLTVDYGWLWFLSDAIFTLMKNIEKIIGNWGWSIVLITVFIKLCFYRLSASSYRSMANMRKLQPMLEQLKSRFGDDKAKFSQATMELYRKEKVNPLGGCLPILVQIPVFIALYWVLVESVELRHAPFMLWIKDLSAPDPLHILPLIMGLTMFIQQKLNPTPPDPMQAKAMMFMPIFFIILFWSFPAGLVLYWIVNNTLSIIQQWWITRKYSENKV